MTPRITTPSHRLRNAELRHRVETGGKPDRSASAEETTDTAVRRLLYLGYSTLFVLVVLFGGWASYTTIAGAVIVPGRIATDTKRQVVQHPQGGRVAKIHVQDGDLVQAGDLLITLDGDQLRSNLMIVQNQLFDLRSRRARLQSERADIAQVVFPEPLVQAASARENLQRLMKGERTLFHARRTTLHNLISQLERKKVQAGRRISGIEAQLEANRTQYALLSQELTEQITLLDRGLTPKARVLALKRELSVISGQYGLLISQKAETYEEITALEIEQLKLAAERREKAEDQLRDVNQKELTLLEQQRELLSQIGFLKLRAPISGIVHEMAVTSAQSVLLPAEPVLYLIPQDRPIVVDLQIPPIHVDEIENDQHAVLQLSGISRRDAPELTGRIVRISPDASTDRITGLPYYQARVALDQETLAQMSAMPLLPGLPVDVYLRTHDRTPLTYLMAPFLTYFKHAFRET
ncbi:HlyD family type I secretion periplasmic adaptor subunit [Rhodobacteraceae bacterium]|nr:HlyD family type I secretion periplasmic adaptor subunit [Paracoccaceae bacterium]